MSSVPSAIVIEPQQRSVRADSLAASVMILLALTVVQRGVGLLRGVLFCRWLDAEQLGQWDISFGFLMLAAPVAVLGLPGSFGRYVEHYRQQGQLRAFLRRTTLCTVGLAVLGVLIVAAMPGWFSELIYGSDSHQGLVLLLAASLGAVIAYNFSICLFTALRNYRTVSRMQLANTVLFAMLGVGLLMVWREDAASVIVAFGLACAVSAGFGLYGMLVIWRELPACVARLPQSSLWAKLVPFAFWIWAMNWLSNLFEITDRYMLIHHTGLGPEAGLDLVGQYHTARMFPLLIIGVADLFANMITPHLTCDWEAGRRKSVYRRLNTILKLSGLAMVVACAGVLIIAPLLFNTLFAGKFDAGRSVLPWALMCSVWGGLATISSNYIWCAEKSRFRAITLSCAVVLNLGLNLLFVPRYGLLGAVVATSSTQLLEMLFLWTLSWRDGLTVDKRLWVVALLPLMLVTGPWLTLGCAVLVGIGFGPSLRCFNIAETARIARAVRHALDRIVGRRATISN